MEKKPYESIRIFKSSFLEKFTHVHPITPLVIWGPVATWLVWRGFEVHGLGAASVGMLAAIGFFCWTLVEYLLHRFVFHFNAEGAFQERLQFLIHGLHHADPVDPTRLVMPPFAAFVIASVLYSVFYVVLGAHRVDPFFAGFLVGYLCYDYVHYAVHHFTPRTRLGKMLKASHMTHHFVTPDARWGVSSPLWDYVFGTLEASKSVRHGS